MSLHKDIAELQSFWAKRSAFSKAILVASLIPSILSSVSLIENHVFQFLGTALKLVEGWRALFQPLSVLLDLRGDGRSLLASEVDLLIISIFLTISTVRSIIDRTASIGDQIIMYLSPLTTFFLMIMFFYAKYNLVFDLEAGFSIDYISIFVLFFPAVFIFYQINYLLIDRTTRILFLSSVGLCAIGAVILSAALEGYARAMSSL